MDRLAWTSCLLILLSCISTTNTVYGHELSEGLELMNDEAVKIQGDAAFPAIGDPASMKADITYLVHANKGAKKSEIEDLVNFLKSLLTHANIASGDVRVALAFYKQNIRVNFDFNTYSTKAEVLDALDLFKESKVRSPKANVAAALKSLPRLLLNENKGNRADAKNYIILVTDLEATIKKNIETNAKILKNSGAEILTVGVGLPDSAELRTIASEPSGLHSFFVDDYASLSSVTSNILNMIPPLDDVSALIPTVPVPSKPANPRVYTTSDELDLVFAIHLSEKVNDVEIRELTVYIKDLLERANIAPGKVRVGAVAYTDVGTILFNLREFRNVSLITEILASQLSKHKSDSANVASLLETVRTKVFGDPSSDRANVPNALLIITDKNSNMQLDQISSQAELTRNAGNRIFTVGIQLDDKAELETISSKPTDQNVFAVISFNELPLTKREIISQLYALRADAPVTTTVAPKAASEAPSPTQPDRVEVPTNSPEVDTPEPATLPPTAPPPPPSTTTEAPPPPPPTTAPPPLPPTTTAEPILEPVVTSAEPPVSEIEDETTERVLVETVIEIGIEKEKKAEDAVEESVLEIVVEEKQEGPTEESIIEIGGVLGIKGITAETLVEIGVEEKKGRVIEEKILEIVTQPPLTEKPIPPRKPETPWPTPSRKPAKPSPSEVETGQDIILMLDTSVDISLFQWMIAFARAFTGQADVNSGQMRIGLMVFSDEPYVEAQLNSHLNQADLLQVVDSLPHKKGKSDKARAFRKVTTQMFTPLNGDRPKAANKIILLTGAKTVDSARVKEEARLAKENSGAEVFVLGLNASNPEELNAIGSLPTDEHVFLFKDPSVVLRETARLLDKIQEEYIPPVPKPTPATTTTRRTKPPKPTPRRTTPRRTTPRRTTPTTTTRRTTTTTTTRRPTPPRVYRPSECTSKSDILFIVDSSGSVGDEDFRKEMDFVYRTIDSLDINSGLYNVGLISFSDQARIEFYLNSYLSKEELENATASVKYVYGSTHTAMAFRVAREAIFTEVNGDRPDAPNLIIMITDGQSNINHEETLPQAQMLKDSGVTILTVAIGFATHTDELIGMTSKPVEENLFYVDRFSGLEDLHTKIVEPICKDRNHCETNPCKNGAECYDTLRDYICICAEGYFGPDCEKTCPQPADIAFVFDTSSSVGINAFNQMKSFVENLIRDLEAEKCDHHIAVMKYSSRPIVEFSLDRYNNPESMIRAINGMSYTRGYANMASAMKALRQRIFNGQNGDRSAVKNIAYLLTDGQVDVAKEETLSQAELTISSGIHVVPIGFDLRNREEVDSIAASQGIKSVEILTASDVGSLSESLLYAVFDSEDRCNPNPCSNGATCINQALSFRCECILGYSGETCEKRCESEADVVFVVDTSRYIPQRLLKQVKRMLRRTIKRLSFKSKNMRVGLVSFDEKARVRLYLNNGDGKRNVLAAISSLRLGKRNPNPGNALRLANQRLFDSNNGDRRDVPNYLVLVTKSARDLDNMVAQAYQLKMKGTRIIAIALTGTTASTAVDLSEIVSLPLEKNKYIIPNNTEDHEIFDIIENLVEVVCYEKACLYSPCHNGGTCLPDDGTYVCQCPPGYAGRHCETACNQDADIVFLLDSSGSVSKDEFRQMKEFVISVSEKFSIGYSKTRIGAATYSSTALPGFNLNTFNSANKLRNALSSLPYIYGSTNIAAGLELVRSRMLHYKAGDRPQTQNFVIVLTNGRSNINSVMTIPEAEKLKKHAHVYTIAIGSFDNSEIKDIASAPAALNAFTVPDYEALFQITDRIVGTICQTSTPCDDNPCQNGGICVPSITTYTCECILGYTGKTCERRCNPKKDIAFIVDSSSSIGAENFNRILTFVSNLVGDLSHENANMRYALITYNTKGTLVFSFGRYFHAKLIRDIIEHTSYSPGSTNIAAGLRNAVDIFSDGYGSRSDADTIAIVITDGYSNVDAHLTIPTAEALKSKVKKVIGIGIGLTNTDEVMAIASGENNVFLATDFNSLQQLQSEVLASTCAGDDKVEIELPEIIPDIEKEPIKIDVA